MYVRVAHVIFTHTHTTTNVFLQAGAPGLCFWDGPGNLASGLLRKVCCPCWELGTHSLGRLGRGTSGVGLLGSGHAGMQDLGPSSYGLGPRLRPGLQLGQGFYLEGQGD